MDKDVFWKTNGGSPNDDRNKMSEDLSPKDTQWFKKNHPDERIDYDSDSFLWSIDDDTFFYPLGITHQYNDVGKSVVITWDENYLVNFVLKKTSKKAGTTMTKIRIEMPVHEKNGESEVIKDILILELNSLLLMQSGRVYYFSSMKSMHPIQWLDSVRCISRTKNGFGVIRLKSEHSVLMEIYQDTVNIGSAECQLEQRYDITFDDINLFNCQWRDEHFTLNAQLINEGNLEFMQQLTLDSSKLTAGQEVYLFTVSGNMFVLAPAPPEDEDDNESDYHIQLLCTYVPNVEYIKVDTKRRFCVVLLACGSIDVWHISPITNGIMRRVHHLAKTFSCYDFCNADTTLYYTDEEKVARVAFAYDSDTDAWRVEETIKPIAGIVVCTWIENIHQLICLNVNNLFYQIGFSKHDDVRSRRKSDSSKCQSIEKLTELYELSPTKLAIIAQKAKVVEELLRYPAQLQSAIDKELAKRELLAVPLKREILTKLINARLELTLEPPTSAVTTKDKPLLCPSVNHSMQANVIWSLIHLKIDENAIFTCGFWNLRMDYQRTTHCVNISKDLINTSFCIAVPLKLSRNHSDFTLDINLSLISFVAKDSDNVAIVLPINLQTSPDTYYNLFRFHLSHLSIYTELNLRDLLKTYTNQAKKSKKPLVSHIVHFPKISNMLTVLKTFSSKEMQNPDLPDVLNLYCMRSPVELSFNEESKSLTLTGVDAFALYYTKLYLYCKLGEVPDGTLESEALKIVLHRLQCALESGLCPAIDVENNIHDKPHVPLLSNVLRQIYLKMRKEINI